VAAMRSAPSSSIAGSGLGSTAVSSSAQAGELKFFDALGPEASGLARRANQQLVVRAAGEVGPWWRLIAVWPQTRSPLTHSGHLLLPPGRGGERGSRFGHGLQSS